MHWVSIMYKVSTAQQGQQADGSVILTMHTRGYPDIVRWLAAFLPKPDALVTFRIITTGEGESGTRWKARYSRKNDSLLAT